MAGFSDVMKRWREICIDNNNAVDRCINCPLFDNNVCGYLDVATDEDIEEAENIIMKFVKKEDEEA